MKEYTNSEKIEYYKRLLIELKTIVNSYEEDQEFTYAVGHLRSRIKWIGTRLQDLQELKQDFSERITKQVK